MVDARKWGENSEPILGDGPIEKVEAIFVDGRRIEEGDWAPGHGSEWDNPPVEPFPWWFLWIVVGLAIGAWTALGLPAPW
jgi:hypothetical protein